MEEPVVTIVVLSYQFALYLRECIESVLNQETKIPYEVIVVDDASTDGTREFIGTLNDPRVTVIQHSRNLGHARTVEDGLRAARGRFVSRIDGDDRYAPGFLQATVPVLEEHPEVGLVHGDVRIIDGKSSVTQVRAPQGNPETVIESSLVPLLMKNFVCAPTVIARRECWTSLLPVPEHLPFHDWYFTVGIARRWKFAYVPEVLADYRVHSTNLHSQLSSSRKEEPGVLWMLDMVYSQDEVNPIVERSKKRHRRKIYGAHYLDFGQKYFGLGYTRDARRCFVRALVLYPRFFLTMKNLRLLGGSLVGVRRYERWKARLLGGGGQS